MDDDMRRQIRAAAKAPLKNALYINLWTTELSGCGPDPGRQVLVARKGRGPRKSRRRIRSTETAMSYKAYTDLVNRMRYKAYTDLVNRMRAEPRDFPLAEIYQIVCRPPHQKGLTTNQLHSRCSRAIGEARAALKKQGYVLGLGALRHSYRASKRKR